MCNLCVCVCVRDASEDKLCCAGPVCSNVIDQSELYRIDSNDNNKIKSMQIHESKRKYSQSESKCNLLLEIHICMYVCLYLCLCVCNANNYELLRLYGCVVIGQTVCLAVPSVRMCVCVRVCQWVLLCECVCVCLCDSQSALIKARPARNSSLLSLANIIRQQRHQLCVQTAYVLVCESDRCKSSIDNNYLHKQKDIFLFCFYVYLFRD